MWIDELTLELASGCGGDGAISFHREKFVDRGGPDGGNGGRGGDFVVTASRASKSLAALRGKRRLAAADGIQGGVNNRFGKRGEDYVLELPIGTVIREARTGRVLVDLAEEGERHILIEGGRGGRGNAEFASSTNQAPSYREIGEPGRDMEVKIEIKLIADVGIVGLPNAGKSTLLSRVSAARPKIADYPFTTLEPLLGVVEVGDSRFVLADLPGIIAGAHEGKGLGLKFLRHIERTRLIIHLIDSAGEDPMADFELIRDELHAYGNGLDEKPSLVVFSRIDAMPDFKAPIEGALMISSVSGRGIPELLHEVARRLAALPPVKVFAREYFAEATPEAAVNVRRDGDIFILEGDALTRYLARRDPDNIDGWRKFWNFLERWGVSKELKRLGIKEGDTVMIGDKEFEYQDSEPE